MFTPTDDTSVMPHHSTAEIPAYEWLDLATALLIHYSFDLSGYSASELVNLWQQQYSVSWLHLAVIEALYQGRYKAISVQQILRFWQRRAQVSVHFNMEFERMICSKFPESLTSLSPTVLPSVKTNTTVEKARNSLAIPEAVSHVPLQLVSGEEGLSEKATNREQTKSANITKVEESGREYGDVLTKVSPSVSQSSLATNPRVSLGLSLSACNHRPIGQFTPEKSDRSESLTSKLKAIALEIDNG